MANFFAKAANDAKALEQSILGPDYEYYKYINSPEDMGMSSDGSMSAITDDVAGLINYVMLLSSGGGPASKTGKPLGDKFFLPTGAKCKDKASGEDVTRSLYVNNVPDGSIPFLTAGTGVRIDSLQGLIPGTLSNLAQINPMQMFGAFMEGTTPECQAITMETIDINNIKTNQTGFVTTNDIQNMNPRWFPNNVNPVTGTQGFTTIRDSKVNKSKHKKVDYSIMPNDVVVKLYYSSIGLLLLYIFVKLFKERK